MSLTKEEKDIAKKLNLKPFVCNEQLYWNNSKDNLHLAVQKSTIPNGGNGVFSYERVIRKGQLIGYYEGVVYHVDGPYKSKTNDYGMTLDEKTGWYIDAEAFPRSIIAMVNDVVGSNFKPNTEFSLLTHDPVTRKKLKGKDIKCFLTASTNIYYGEELFASYGDEYWSARLK